MIPTNAVILNALEAVQVSNNLCLDSEENVSKPSAILGLNVKTNYSYYLARHLFALA